MRIFLSLPVIKRRSLVFSLCCVLAGTLLTLCVLRGAEAASSAGRGDTASAAKASSAEGAGVGTRYGRRFPDNILGEGGRPIFNVGGMSSALLMSPFFQNSSAHSLSLGGGSRVDVPSGASLNITGAVTGEAWVKTNSTGDQAVVERYAPYPGAGVANGGYVLRLMGRRVTFATLKNQNEYDYVQGAATVTTGVRHHVAGAFDGAQLRVYQFYDQHLMGIFYPTPGSAPTGVSSDITTRLMQNCFN